MFDLLPLPLVLLLFFSLGAIIGSFLNVVILRYNTGQSLQGRSQCFSCLHTLRWFDLVPILSFFALRGRCRTCGSLLSWQYPAVEVLTGGLFAGLALNGASLGMLFLLAVIFCLYVVIAAYDVRHSIVPNVLAYTAALIAFAMLFIHFEDVSFQLPALWAVLAGPVVAAPLFFLWLFSGGTWMGLGDAKLTLSIGWILGIAGGVAALFVAFWAGALMGLGLILYKRVCAKLHMQNISQKWVAGKSALPKNEKELTMKHEIPFAPFLLFGFFLAFFLNLTVFDLLLW